MNLLAGIGITISMIGAVSIAGYGPIIEPFTTAILLQNLSLIFVPIVVGR